MPTNTTRYADLDNRLAVVTGGGRGIGLATVRGLAEQGVRVVVLDRAMSEGDIAAEPSSGVRAVAGAVSCEFIELDVTDAEAVDQAVSHIAAQRGTPDILLSAAGIVRTVDALEMTTRDWNDVIDVNLSGLYYVCRAVGRLMVERGAGSVINIASMSGIISNYPQAQVGYNSSKAGVVHLSRSLAAEWGGRGVRVNAISPGYIRTDMTRETMESRPERTAAWLERIPLGRFGTTDEVVNAILFLASDASSYVTGSNLVIDGGYTVW